MEEIKPSVKYTLFKKDRIFENKTLTTLYFRSNKKIEKSCGPIDINGERFRLDYETGEIMSYKRKDVEKSLSASISRSVALLNMLLDMNSFDWFATLTFDKHKIDRTNDELIYNAYVKYINNISHRFPSFRYITVLERHEDGCIHFHMLIGGLTVEQLGLVDSGKVACHWAYFKSKVCSKEFFERTKNNYELTETDGLPIYNVSNFIWGITTVSRIVSRERCNSYIKKYINKDIGHSTDIFRKRFFYSQNLKRPAIIDRVIGAGFSQPFNLSDYGRRDIYCQSSDRVYYNDKYNTLQFWQENSVKSNIDKGLIPLSEKEIKELGEVF